MTTNDIATVVNLVSDKVGKSIGTLAPLAEEVVRQYQARALIWAVASAIVVLVGIALTVIGIRGIEENEDYAPPCTILGVAVAIVGFLLTCVFLGQYIAPLPSLVGK